MRRMVLPEHIRTHRATHRAAQKLRDTLLQRAADSLSLVGKAHFKLERIYSAAMDFEAKEAYTEEILDRMFSMK